MTDSPFGSVAQLSQVTAREFEWGSQEQRVGPLRIPCIHRGLPSAVESYLNGYAARRFRSKPSLAIRTRAVKGNWSP